VTGSRTEDDQRVEVEVVYFEGCPSWRVARERLVQALTQLGRTDASVSLVRVSTAGDAAAAGFAGSPTIRVDGRDLFPAAAVVTDALACRVYSTSRGPAGVPTVADMVTVLSDGSRS
jgi:hypothetical protein